MCVDQRLGLVVSGVIDIGGIISDSIVTKVRYDLGLVYSGCHLKIHRNKNYDCFSNV